MAFTITQAFDHIAKIVRGMTDPIHQLLKVAPPSPTVLNGATTWPAGRVGYIVTSGADAGTFALADGASLSGEMPLFLMQGGFDLDVANSVVDGAGTVVAANAMPAGMITGIVASGAYEIQSTEFVEAGGSVSYAPNTPLTATDDANGDGGLLTPGEFYTDWICGVCSTHVGVRWDRQTPGYYPTNPIGATADNYSVLTFWSYFLPKDTRE